MALPITVDSLDTLDEGVRNLYIEEGGKFRLDLDGYEDPTGLKTALQKERDAAKDAKRRLAEAEGFKAQFDGLDIESVKALLSKASTDEETRLLAEGKLDEVLNKRTERLRGDYDKQLQAEKARAEKAEAFANQFKHKVLADSIRSAALKAGALQEASEDIILRARGTFQLNENGEAMAVDKDGEIICGKDGKSPLTPLEWAESLRESAPHLWPKAVGAGPTGDRGAKGASKKASEMNATEKAQYISEHGLPKWQDKLSADYK